MNTAQRPLTVIFCVKKEVYHATSSLRSVKGGKRRDRHAEHYLLVNDKSVRIKVIKHGEAISLTEPMKMGVFHVLNDNVLPGIKLAAEHQK